MTLQRFVAMMILVPLVHLNAVRADAACASHEPVTLDSSAGHSSNAAHEGHHASAPAAPTQDEESCDAPASRDCCQALAACSIALGASDESAAADVVAAADRWRAAARDVPPSVLIPPDTPPPRE